MSSKVGFRFAAIASACLFLYAAGCENWDAGGEVEGWSDAWNWVNFSGMYKAKDGLAVVKPGEPTLPEPPPGPEYFEQQIGVGDAVNATFGGKLQHLPALSGSVTVTDGFETFTDPDGDETLTGTKGGSGYVDYEAGSISVSFFLPPNAGIPIMAYYTRQQEPEVETDVASGSTKAIGSLQVFQEGNIITIQDNYGNVFQGNLGGVRSTSGDIVQTRNGVIVAQYTAYGRAFGYDVSLAGTFQGAISEDNENVLFDRQINGTWIERGGKSGTIQAGASSIAVELPTPDYDDRPDFDTNATASVLAP